MKICNFEKSACTFSKILIFYTGKKNDFGDEEDNLFCGTIFSWVLHLHAFPNFYRSKIWICAWKFLTEMYKLFLFDTWWDKQRLKFVSKRYLSSLWIINPKCRTSFTYNYSMHVFLHDSISNAESNVNDDYRIILSIILQSFRNDKLESAPYVHSSLSNSEQFQRLNQRYHEFFYDDVTIFGFDGLLYNSWTNQWYLGPLHENLNNWKICTPSWIKRYTIPSWPVWAMN